jgi:isopentenyl-diphosphate delta-isomerase
LRNVLYTDVILVDDQDREIGRMEKLEAHQKGLLHRAFSVFIFNDRGELLIQQRASDKYHSGGLWTNTCCSHPSPGETIIGAANRRLQDEMEMKCELKDLFQFTYKANLDNDLIEHELDHILVGFSNNDPNLNPEEAMGFMWKDLSTIEKELQINPELYTFWFKEIINNEIERFREILKINH